jgi:hypothetical protein
MIFPTINLLTYFHCSPIPSPIYISSSSFDENTIQSLSYNWIILLQKLLILIYYGHHPPITSIIVRILLLLSQEPDINEKIEKLKNFVNHSIFQNKYLKNCIAKNVRTVRTVRTVSGSELNYIESFFAKVNLKSEICQF